MCRRRLREDVQRGHRGDTAGDGGPRRPGDGRPAEPPQPHAGSGRRGGGGGGGLAVGGAGGASAPPRPGLRASAGAVPGVGGVGWKLRTSWKRI